MEFKKAMRIWKRMCEKHDRCADCPMLGEVGDCPGEPWGRGPDPETVLAKWAEEHPEKTIADDFFEKHPKAKRCDDGTPAPCAEDCGYVDKCLPGEMPCADCWRRPLEEAHHD